MSKKTDPIDDVHGIRIIIAALALQGILAGRANPLLPEADKAAAAAVEYADALLAILEGSAP